MFPGNIRSINDNSPNTNNGPNCREYLQQAWDKVPLFVRIVIILSVVLYLFSFFEFLQANLLLYLINIPSSTVYKFYVWSIFTSVFINLSILNLLFAMISWVPSSIQQEQKVGTIKYMLNFLMHSISIELLYVIISMILFKIFPTMSNTPSSGLWPLLMAEITLSCCSDPEKPVVMMFIPYPFKAKYYPWALTGFFALINGFQIQYDAIIGIIYAYFYFFYLKNYLSISDSLIALIDNLFPFKYLKNLKGYVSMNGSNTSFTFTNSQSVVQRPTIQAQQNNVVPTSQSSTPTIIAFKGKGIVVGGNNESVVNTSLSNVTLNPQNNTEAKKQDNKYHSLKEEEV